MPFIVVAGTRKYSFVFRMVLDEVLQDLRGGGEDKITVHAFPQPGLLCLWGVAQPVVAQSHQGERVSLGGNFENIVRRYGVHTLSIALSNRSQKAVGPQ